MTIPENFLSTSKYFYEFTSTELELIFSFFRRKYIKKKEIILDFGEVCSEVIFIESGILREFNFVNEAEATTWVLAEGYFTYSLSSFNNQLPSKYCIQAITDSEVFVISKSDYENLIEKVPNTVFFLLRIHQYYLQKYEYRMELLRMKKPSEKYLKFLEEEQELNNRIPMKIIASYLNIDATTLSKVRKGISHRRSTRKKSSRT